MNKGTADRRRLVVYLLVTWLLLWSLIRMLFFPGQLTSDSILASLNGLFVVAFTGILALVWAFGGPLLLSQWPKLSGRVINMADGPRWAVALVWLFPFAIWFLAYSLFAAAWPINPSMVDGPVIVLALIGSVFFVVLLRHRILSSEPEELEQADGRQAGTGQLSQYWHSLPAAAKNALALFLLGLMVIWWFRGVLFDAGVIVYGGDILDQHYDLEAYASRLLRAGQFPFWNPYIYGGTPFSAHPQSLVFYPPQLILRLLPLNLSVSWAIAFHVWIAGAGMFALARWKGIQFWISFLCAVVYMLNGGILLRIFAGHIWLAYALSLLPLVWLAIIVALNSGNVLMIIAAGAGTALIILTGHPAVPIYILLFFGFYWLWVCYLKWKRERSWRSVAVVSGRFVAIVALAFGLSAIQIVPTLIYYSQVSLSQGYGASGANFLSISLADLTALIVPNYYLTGHQFSHYWELTPYVGVLFLLLSPLAHAARRADWFRDFLSASALASMAIALGASIGVYFVLYYLLPPFRVARIPPRSLVIFIPAVTLLGGIGLQTVADRAANSRLFSLITRAYFFSSVFIFGIALGVWLVNNGLVGIQLSESAILPAQLVIGALLFSLAYAKLAGLVPAPNAGASHIIFAVALSAFGLATGILLMPQSQPVARQLALLSLLIAVSTLLLVSVYRQGSRPLAILGFMVLVFFDLFVSGRSYIRAIEPPVFYQDERLALQDGRLQEFERVMSNVDEPNQYMLGQVGNVDGYNSGILIGYEQFLRGVSGAAITTSPRILLDGSIPDAAALSFLGARYVFSEEPVEDERLERINAGGDAYVYENSDTLPRAYVVFDAIHAGTAEDALAALTDGEFDYASQVVVEEPVGVGPAPDGVAAADIVHYSEADGSMLIRVETNEPGIVVLSEPYYSERSAWLDGQEVELLRANLGFIGVPVPAGSHDVELRYEPTSLYTGGAVTAFSILVVAVALVWSISRRSIRSEGETIPG